MIQPGGNFKHVKRGDIGIGIDHHESRPVLHNLISLAQIISKLMLGKGFGQKKYEGTKVNTNFSTHAFVVTDKKDKRNITIAEADVPGVTTHNYKLSTAIDSHHKKGDYTHIKVLRLKDKNAREHLAKFSEIAARKDGIPHDIDRKEHELEKLEAQLTKLNIKKIVFPKKKSLKLAIRNKKTEILELKVDISRLKGKKLLEKATRIDSVVFPKYNKIGAALSPFLGKLPFLDWNPFTGELTERTKKRMADSLYRSYVDIKNNHVITKKDGTPKDMICSEFASRMIKLALIESLVEKHETAHPDIRKNVPLIQSLIRAKIESDPFFQLREAGTMPVEIFQNLSPHIK